MCDLSVIIPLILNHLPEKENRIIAIIIIVVNVATSTVGDRNQLHAPLQSI